MLVLTLRPTVFLLGIGSRGFPAASVLRVACRENYGAVPTGLEANGAKVRATFPQAGWAAGPRPATGQPPRWRGSGGAAARPVTRSTYIRCWLRARTPPSAGVRFPFPTPPLPARRNGKSRGRLFDTPQSGPPRTPPFSVRGSSPEKIPF